MEEREEVGSFEEEPMTANKPLSAFILSVAEEVVAACRAGREGKASGTVAPLEKVDARSCRWRKFSTWKGSVPV